MSSTEVTEWVVYFKIKSDKAKRDSLKAKANASENKARNKRGRK